MSDAGQPHTGRLALIGVGVMGTTVLSGLLTAGWNPDQITIADRRGPHLDQVSATYQVPARPAVEAVSGAEIVVLVTKPGDLAQVLDEIAAALSSDALVVSLCAGITTAQIEAHLPTGQPVVRVMPNTPALVGEGMSAVSAGAHASDAHLDQVAALMGALGRVVTIPEQYQDAVTAVSGSGPAYVFLVAEAMIDAAVGLGLTRDVATELVSQTLVGSAHLLRDSGEHPTVLRERVTSPGGTTAAALAVLEDRGLRAAFSAAMTAARDRSKALSNPAQ